MLTVTMHLLVLKWLYWGPLKRGREEGIFPVPGRGRRKREEGFGTAHRVHDGINLI